MLTIEEFLDHCIGGLYDSLSRFEAVKYLSVFGAALDLYSTRYIGKTPNYSNKIYHEMDNLVFFIKNWLPNELVKLELTEQPRRDRFRSYIQQHVSQETLALEMILMTEEEMRKPLLTVLSAGEGWGKDEYMTVGEFLVLCIESIDDSMSNEQIIKILRVFGDILDKERQAHSVTRSGPGYNEEFTLNTIHVTGFLRGGLPGLIEDTRDWDGPLALGDPSKVLDEFLEEYVKEDTISFLMIQTTSSEIKKRLKDEAGLLSP